MCKIPQGPQQNYVQIDDNIFQTHKIYLFELIYELIKYYKINYICDMFIS